MKITAIKQQVKTQERVSVFVDGAYVFSLSLDELIIHKLKKDQELSNGDLKKLKKISADGKIRARALEWLLNRPHSEREFRDYLYRKKAASDQIESLVAEFTKKGYLDNAKFAAWFVELQSRKNKSNRAIKFELFRKGISGEVVEEVIGQSEEGEEQKLNMLIAKKAGLTRYKNDQAKLIKYLTSQGFNYSDIKRELAPKDPDLS